MGRAASLEHVIDTEKQPFAKLKLCPITRLPDLSIRGRNDLYIDILGGP
jgi:hypothetical protein